MASLALGLTGAAIGSNFGNIGASIGWAIGSYIGASLFTDDINTYGPRLSDLKVTSSAYGAFIPTVYGTYRIAGNVIWSAGLKETAHTQSVGGKGGPSQTHTSYTYSCSFAVGLCEGTITGIRKIWADGTLIYNKGDTATADELAVSNQVGITVYTGSETQEPDPLMEADKGVGNVPAHRGLAYVVFEDLQLEKYGNRIPNITCEVIESGSQDLTWRIHNVPEASWNNLAYGNGVFVAVSETGPTPVAVSPDGVVWQSVTTPAAGWVVTYGAGLFVAVAYQSSSVMTSSDGISWDISSAVYGPWVSIAYGNGVFTAVGSNSAMTSPDGINWTNRTTPLGNWHRVTYGNGKFVAIAFNSSKTMQSTDGITWVEYAALSAKWSGLTYGGGLFVAVSTAGAISSMVSSNGTSWTAGSLGTRAWSSVAYGNGLFVAVAYEANGGTAATSVNGIDWNVNTNFLGSLIAVAYGNNSFVAIESIAPFASVVSDNIIGDNSTGVASVISDLCSKANVTQLSTTGITDTVKGYVRTNPMTAKAALDPLLSAYNITAVESDYTLKFSKKEGSADLAVDIAQLSASVSGTVDPLKISRVQEVDIPRRVTVAYASESRNYEQGIQYAQRIKSSG